MEENFYKDTQPPPDMQVLHVDPPQTIHSSQKKTPKIWLLILGMLCLCIGIGLAGGNFLLRNAANFSLPTRPTSTPTEKIPSITNDWETYINKKYFYSFLYPDKDWQTDKKLSDKAEEILFYPNNIDLTSEITKPVIEIYISSVSFAESEKTLAIKDEKTGYYVSNIKKITVGSTQGYSYVPHDCPRPICATEEIIFPINGGVNTLTIGNIDRETREFKDFISTFTFDKVNGIDTKDWKSYKASGYYFLYPPTWVIADNYDKIGGLMVYNPKSVQTFKSDGGSSYKYPTEFVDILSSTPSKLTASAYVAPYISAAKKNNIIIQSENEIDQNYEWVLYDNTGEGSRGRNLAITNGITLMNLQTSLKHLSSKTNERIIIDTLTFVY